MSDEFNVKPEDVVSFRDAFRPDVGKREPSIDKAVSDIVGKPIRVTDPRLIKLIIKWKQEKGETESPDKFLENEDKIAELKEALK